MKNFKKNPEKINGAVLWFINDICNYRCSYCFACRSSRAKVNNYRLHLKAIEKHIPKNWRFNISGGGEPFVHPDFFQIISGLARAGRRTGITTNLSSSLNDLLKFFKITENKLDFFIASLHLEFITADSFLEKLIIIREKTPFFKNFITVSVALPDKLSELAAISKRYNKHGIKLLLQRWQVGRKFFQYTKLQDEIIKKNNYLIYKSVKNKSKNYFNKDRGCDSGFKSVLLSPNGSIFRCVPLAHKKTGYLGSIFQEKSFILKKKIFAEKRYVIA